MEYLLLNQLILLTWTMTVFSCLWRLGLVAMQSLVATCFGALIVLICR